MCVCLWCALGLCALVCTSLWVPVCAYMCAGLCTRVPVCLYLPACLCLRQGPGFSQ